MDANPTREETLNVLFQASREVTHAATQLCSVGASLAQGDERALEASLRVARAALALDDRARAGPAGPWEIHLAVQALEAAESSIRAARRSLESSLVVHK